jgi:hypothetical protein
MRSADTYSKISNREHQETGQVEEVVEEISIREQLKNVANSKPDTTGHSEFYNKLKIVNEKLALYKQIFYSNIPAYERTFLERKAEERRRKQKEEDMLFELQNSSPIGKSKSKSKKPQPPEVSFSTYILRNQSIKEKQKNGSSFHEQQPKECRFAFKRLYHQKQKSQIKQLETKANELSEKDKKS